MVYAEILVSGAVNGVEMTELVACYIPNYCFTNRHRCKYVLDVRDRGIELFEIIFKPWFSVF